MRPIFQHILAAPAGLLFAKIIVPQTEKFSDDMAVIDQEKPANILDSAAAGASPVPSGKQEAAIWAWGDRKSTRLNSSH